MNGFFACNHHSTAFGVLAANRARAAEPDTAKNACAGFAQNCLLCGIE
jgi:hypothetical protein